VRSKASSSLLTNTTNSSDCQTQGGHIPGDQPEEGLASMYVSK